MTKLSTSEIQGNILIGYTYTYARHLFFRIDNLDGARAILRDLELTSAYWPDGAKAPPRAVNIGFTQRGLRRLGCTLELSQDFPAFAQGMAERRELRDKPFEGRWAGVDVWVAIYGTRASESEPSAADALAESLLERLPRSPPSLTLTHEIRTDALLRNETRYEHFGFQDNIGNPEVEGARSADKQKARLNLGTGKLVPNGRGGEELAAIRAGEFVLGYENEAGLNEPQNELGKFVENGTFAVFRQLEQDVSGFRSHMQALAEAYGRTADEWASLIVGRRPDGTPLSKPQGSDPWLNDFGYRRDGDIDGARCPIGAHIRRAHPRDASGVMDGSHRIMRRGMPYGPPLPEQQRADNEERGLCFIAYNASIERQFEFIQQHWINASASAGIKDDFDPLTCVSDDDKTNMVVQGDTAARRLPVIIQGIPSFVHCRGGAYFFMPSLTTFRSLTSPSRIEAQAAEAS
jgi:Dyp-type peroxidase family